MKKRLAVLLSIIMTFVILSGCSSNKTTASNNKIKILLSISDGSDDYRKLIVSNAKSYAESQNIDITVKDAAGSIESQVEHMKEAVSGGYNVIICAPVNPSTALELERASKGIPIVFMNSKPEDKLLEKDKYIYVASNEEVAGKLQAEYIIDHFNGKKDIKVVLLKGEKGHNASKGRSDAVKQTFKDNGINAEYVFEDNADWSRQKAKEMLNIFLATGKKFDCVIANNDSMALGVVDSLLENHIDPSSIPVLGVDATSDALKAVKNGTLGVTVYQSAKGQSISAVKAAIKMGSGDSLSGIENLTTDGKFIWVPFEKVDKSNVDKYIN
ncbi:substrate-binding domain-containing protein [Clostridium manihotivorum]|uniref:Sugar ABC transporter substrate-binding protein n=1 Tax=Clostridium manihotivorum TaxID=2320868 RepID=A0A3R5X185_9CLOT|nr:substrate-binding domain-containing protein [Clostridium manihotivorum]QAA31810.1 sugar ABC transporter substrate-binding protein [Clostridium manihotivorum]